jgi:hypothetical protein
MGIVSGWTTWAETKRKIGSCAKAENCAEEQDDPCFRFLESDACCRGSHDFGSLLTGRIQEPSVAECRGV